MRRSREERSECNFGSLKTSITAQQLEFLDHQPATMEQDKPTKMANACSRVSRQRALSEAIHHSPRMAAQCHQMTAVFSGALSQRGEGAVLAEASLAQRKEKTNNTGLPNQLKSGIEALSGMSMDHVTVHYNSEKPAQLQAHAYAQGSEIYLSPRQERHLPHEAWHIVQQAQGRVRPTLQTKAGAINDDPSLEKEADMMGEKAAQFKAVHRAGKFMAEEHVASAVSQRITAFTRTSSLMPAGSIIQREVHKDGEGSTVRYYSDLDPDGTRYNDLEVAQNVDKVLAELDTLREYAAGQMVHIPKEYLGRLQRIETNNFNSWIPHAVRQNAAVSSLLDSLVLAMKFRKVEIPDDNELNDRTKWKEWADLWEKALVDDGFGKATDIANSIRGNLDKPHFASGYVFQLASHMRSRSNYTLNAVEYEIGLPKPSTGQHARADERLVIASTQDTQPVFYEAADEKRETVLVEYKKGYKIHQQAEPIYHGLKQYGGVAMDNGTEYGGIEHTQSTQPQLVYQWPNNRPPEHIEVELPRRAEQIRSQNPMAFPSGLRLGNVQVLGPAPGTEAYRKQYSDHARELVRAINHIIHYTYGVLSQANFGWEQWTGTYDDWRKQRIDEIRGKFTDSEIASLPE